MRLRSTAVQGLAVLVLATACTSKYQIRGTEVTDTIFRTNGPDATPATAGRQRDECLLVGAGERHRACQIELEHQSVEQFADFEIGVLEISDEGLFNAAQQRQVIERLNERHEKGKGLLVVFVHGWHHGARTCDRDLACFREVLTRIAQNLSPDETLTGLYVGWRGESIYVPKLNVVTIRDRKTAAEHIGRTAGRELFIELSHLWERNQGLRMITVGHSLGGAFVLSAVKGQLTGNVADIELGRIDTYRVVRARTSRLRALQEGSKAERERFGNLLVLINPAIESYEYTMFDSDLYDEAAQALDRRELVERRLPYDKKLPYAAGQLPILVTIAGEADTAVGRIFPLARVLGGLLFLNKLSPKHVVGLGHFDPHVTHRLSYDPDVGRIAEGADGSSESVDPDCRCSKRFGDVSLEEMIDLDASRQEVAGFILEQTPARQGRGWAPRSPYLVIRASKEIVSEHSDIFNPRLVGFLELLLAASERQGEILRRPAMAPAAPSGSPER